MKEKRKNTVEGAILWQQGLPHPISTNHATVINQFYVSVKDWHATAILLTKVLTQMIIMFCLGFYVNIADYRKCLQLIELKEVSEMI